MNSDDRGPRELEHSALRKAQLGSDEFEFLWGVKDWNETKRIINSPNSVPAKKLLNEIQT